jgi:hypothetical protein
MTTTPQVIDAIIESLPNNSGLDIYAQNIPNMQPPKLTSEKTEQSFTPEMLIKTKDFTHIFSIETKESKSLTDSYLDKIRLFYLHTKESNGKLYIVAKSDFLSKAKVELKKEYDDIDYLKIE